ncbi:MAG TPA: hypothetical protein DCS93_10470 [Microscillaceae bacterium]|nr:hypothetical protein [Microscillaceae bacterium]
MSVHKEIWTGEVIRKFRKDTSFLERVPDRSDLVENRVIHLTELGADPKVLVNNTTYPVTTVDSPDQDIAISLDKFDTENTSVSDDTLYAISIRKMDETTTQHTESLREATGDKAVHAFAPAGNSARTPVITTSGPEVTENGVTRNCMIPADIAHLKRRWDDAKVPKRGRELVLHPAHVQDLISVNESFRDQYINIREGQLLRLFGYTINEYTDLPFYSGAGTKKAFGSVFNPATDKIASVGFVSSEMFKASDRNVKMYWQRADNNPQMRQHVVGFRLWFIALPKTMRAIGAITG